MQKILLIAQREFMTRVQKKTFLLTTILLPLMIFGFYALIIYFSIKTGDDLKIAIADDANMFNGQINNKSSKKDGITFFLVKGQSPQTLKTQVEEKKYDGYIYIPQNYNLLGKDSLQLNSSKTIGLISRDKIQKSFDNVLEDKRLAAFNLSKQQLDSLENMTKIKYATTEGKADDNSKAGVSYITGYISGFLIYIILFIYGTMVMRGVMEEKTNRIAEVIVSSVKPFQLMMGKITGIGAVGLVQFIIWIVLVIGLQMLLPLLFPDMLHHVQQAPMQNGTAQASQAIKDSGGMEEIMRGLHEVNFPMIIGCFLFYFIGGYLLYSSLFAAVGSAVNEDPQDAQSLILPITMPIIFSMVIMTKAVNEPNSALAVFGSLFPLTSPIVMMARVAHGVPEGVTYWQLILSGLLLIGGFMGTTWVAGKIYRIGILMYGKKITWKEMIKWIGRKA